MCELCVRDSPKGELKLLKLKPILNQGAGSPKKKKNTLQMYWSQSPKC